MDINLLNREGVHLKGEDDFFDVDKNLIADASMDFKKDFESTHKTKNINPKSGKKRIFFYCLLIAFIVGASFYYQFYFNKKDFIENNNITSLFDFIVKNKSFNLLDFKYSNYSLSIKIELDSSQNFKDSKFNLKNKLNSLIDSDSYSLEISNDGNSDVLNIYFPEFLEINTSNSPQHNNSHTYIDKIVSKDSLIVIFNEHLKLCPIHDFQISKFELDNSYNYTFLK